jgi:hypothetical protein
MLKKSTAERAPIHAVSRVPAATTLDPGPALAPSTPKAALRRCCSAWQRAFDAFMEKCNGDNPVDNIFAAKDASVAYCSAMPMLAGQDGVRDFLACVAHGILIGAIPKEKSSQLLHAARVTLASIHSDRTRPRAVAAAPLSTKS